MKKCHECEKEVDRFSIACEYCGVLIKHDPKAHGNTALGPQKNNAKVLSDLERKIKKDSK